MSLLTTKTTPQIFDVILEKIEDLGNETRHYELRLDFGTHIEFKAGHFISVVYSNNGKIIRRPYSIASPPALNDQLHLCLKLVNDGLITNWFWKLKEGEKIRVQGPYGKFVLPDQIDSDLLFIATGTGVAPFRSMIYDLLERVGYHRKIYLLFGVRFDHSIPYDVEWRVLSKNHSNFIYIPTVSRPSAAWSGEQGYVQTKIEKFFSSPDNKQVYICGLNEMVKSVREACSRWGYRPDQIRYERYD